MKENAPLSQKEVKDSLCRAIRARHRVIVTVSNMWDKTLLIQPYVLIEDKKSGELFIKFEIEGTIPQLELPLRTLSDVKETSDTFNTQPQFFEFERNRFYEVCSSQPS